MATILRQRRDTEANWVANDPVIPDGQFCVDTTNGTLKLGNGIDVYTALPLFANSVSTSGGLIKELITASAGQTVLSPSMSITTNTEVYINGVESYFGFTIDGSGNTVTFDITLNAGDIVKLVNI